MKIHILLIGTISFFPILCLFGQSSSNNQQLLNILKKSDIGTNAVKYSVEIAKATYNNNNNNQKLANDINKVYPDIKSYNASFQKTISSVKSQSDRDKVIFKSVEFGNSVIMSPVYSVPVIGNIMKEVNNQIFDAAENDLKRNYEKKLAYSLEDLRKKNQSKYNDIIQSKDYNEVKNALDEINFFSEQSYKDVAPEFKEVIKASQEKFVKESVNTTLKRILNDVSNQNINIDEVNQKINNLSQFTYKFAKESNKRFENLVIAQEELNNKVDTFYNEYQKDKKALDFMQDFMYSKMNTKEKISALKSGLFPNLSNEERVKQEAELAIIEKQESVIYSAQEFLNSASISLKIANDLGLENSPLIQDLSTAISYGQTAFGAVTSFMSGNYLGVISSITGLLGGGGPNIAEQRHRQIMERFDRIDNELKQIDQKLDALKEGQKIIIENQQKTFEFLIKLADSINEQHTEIMNEFKTVENAIYINRELITNEWQVKCQSCLEIIQKRLKMDVDQDILPNYDILPQQYANIKATVFAECEKYISRYRFASNLSKINPDFYISSSINKFENAQIINELIAVNNQSFNLLFNNDDFKNNDINKSKLTTSLFYPSTNINELENKYNCKNVITNDENYKFKSQYFLELLMPQAINRHGYVIRNIDFLTNLTDEDRNLISWDRLADKKIILRNLKLELNDAVQLNNIAIAQQAILSGDILLPILYDILETKKNDDSSKHLAEISGDLLSKNSILATNFVNYYFFKKTKNSLLSQSQYSYIYNTKDQTLFSKTVSPIFPVEYIAITDARIKTYNLKEGWHMIISNLPYRIPEPNTINNISLVQTESLPILIDNRNKLYRQLKSYNIYEGLSSDQIENLNYMIMKTQD